MSCRSDCSSKPAFTRKSTDSARRLAALGDTALDVVPLDVVSVVGLDVGGETVERALDRLLGGRVHHAGLPLSAKGAPKTSSSCVWRYCTYVLRRIIWRPADECDLAPGTLARVELVLDIEHGVATANALLALAVLALRVEELLAEGIEVCFLGRLLNDNLFPVVADLVDNPFDVLAELELVEGADALRRYRHTVVILVAAYRRRKTGIVVWVGLSRVVQAMRWADSYRAIVLFAKQYIPGLSLS
jgi:hypothetical protein